MYQRSHSVINESNESNGVVHEYFISLDVRNLPEICEPVSTLSSKSVLK